MNSRPLLDYMADMDPSDERQDILAPGLDDLAKRLEDLEQRLRAPADTRSVRTPEVEQFRQHERPDLNLSAQIEAILRRRELLAPTSNATAAAIETQTEHSRAVSEPVATTPQMPKSRMAVHAPPLADNAGDDEQPMSVDFVKFAEAVHLIGQAARRFIEVPDHSILLPRPAPEPVQKESSEIAGLTMMLKEAISAFRSVADDMAVSAGEIRHLATQREQPQPQPRYQREHRRPHHEEAELHQFQEDLEELQDRLGSLLRKRSARY